MANRTEFKLTTNQIKLKNIGHSALSPCKNVIFHMEPKNNEKNIRSCLILAHDSHTGKILGKTLF